MDFTAGWGKKVVHLGGDEIWNAWDTPALEEWTRKNGRFHNRTDLVDYWIANTIAGIKEKT
ncbi:hypothetical protein Pmar_PMAR015065, partial [Perkinsus marinus ATCC 50983]